jgi:hypothetical protein
MADQAPRGRPDPDDWWESPATPASASRRGPDEDWLEPPRDETRQQQWRHRSPAVTPRIRLLAAVAGGALVLLGLGLLAANVFSSGNPKTATPPTTPARTTTARTSTTTPTTPASPAVVGPSVTLSPGASGPQTKRLQRALASLGDDPGAIDGSYGPLTKKAVETFQRSAGLTADGIFGPKTKAALQRALSRG